MKRWQVTFGGSDAGFVYGETLEEARRAARASFKRVHPDKQPAGQVKVQEPGEALGSEAGEARRIVSEVYEGLRLLPGMETPAEKLRNAMVLLQTAVARDQVGGGLGASGVGGASGGGDTELQEALEPLLEAAVVPRPLKAQLQGLVEWVGLDTPEDKRRDVELRLFQTLFQRHLIDPDLGETPSCRLYHTSAFLVRRLRSAGALKVERFEGVRDARQCRDALRPYPEGAKLEWAFAPDGAMPVEVLRPLAFLQGHQLQRARLARGVAQADEEAVALDRALFDTLHRLRSWRRGLGALAEPLLNEKQRQLAPRAQKRIETARKQMAETARSGTGPVAPPDTARRDLVKFLVDQVHRIADALAFLPDRSLRDAFGELVFKDVVFRGAGPYLSQRFGIDVDTEVVEGADSQTLVGRFKKEAGGPKPRQPSSRVHSVVIPCYRQDGVPVRPASVRLGVY